MEKKDGGKLPKNMKVILSHPTGNANAREAAIQFQKAGVLAEYHTAVATFAGDLPDRIGAFASFADIRRRRLNPELKKFTHTSPWRELGRHFSSRAGLVQLSKHETGIFSVDAVYRGQDRSVASRLKFLARRGCEGVYAYEDGAAISFRKARELGLQCFYDLPIGYWRAARRILGEEYEQKPEWAPTLTGFLDSYSKLIRKDEELSLANRIFVASKFTATTLKEYPGKLAPVQVIPYGFPPVVKERNYTSVSRNKLKLLFVGGLSQRKGIAELFISVEALKPYVELTVVGKKATNSCAILNEKLSRHRWFPTLPHSEILKLMKAHDVLLFPSLFEGFGLVITEAMSQGTPVITTDRTAGPDLIKDEENGWLVKAGSSIALQNSIENLLLRPALIAATGKEAMETARLRPWPEYGRELCEAVQSHFEGKLITT